MQFMARNLDTNKDQIINVSGFGNNCGLNCLVHIICRPENIEKYFGSGAIGLGKEAGRDILKKFNALYRQEPALTSAEMMRLLQENENPYFRERVLGSVLRQLMIDKMETTLGDEQELPQNGLSNFYKIKDFQVFGGFVTHEECAESGLIKARADLDLLKNNPREMIGHDVLEWFSGSIGIKTKIDMGISPDREIQKWNNSMKERLNNESAGVETALKALVPRPIAAVTIVNTGDHWQFKGTRNEKAKHDELGSRDARSILAYTGREFMQVLKSTINFQRNPKIKKVTPKIEPPIPLSSVDRELALLIDETVKFNRLIEQFIKPTEKLQAFHDKWVANESRLQTLNAKGKIILKKELAEVANALRAMAPSLRATVSTTKAYKDLSKAVILRREFTQKQEQKLSDKAKSVDLLWQSINKTVKAAPVDPEPAKKIVKKSKKIKKKGGNPKP
jgi:hypothetical protein